MSTPTTVIDIVAQVTDETAEGVRSSQNNLSKLERSVLKMQQSIERMQRQSRTEIVATLKDYASKGITSLISYGKSLAGKTWSITLKAFDYATAPLKGVLNLLKNPLLQMAALTGVSVGAADTVSTFMDFEQSLANTRAVTGASDADMAKISQMVKDYGASTAFSGSQVGEAAHVLGTAGWSADDIVDGMGGILNMAAAGGTSIDRAAGITASTLNQFQLGKEDSGRVADVFSVGATSAYTNIEELGEAMTYAGSVASGMNYTLEDTMVVLSAFASGSVVGSQAGTTFASMMATMTSGTKDSQEALKALGVSLFDSAGEAIPLLELVGDLKSGFQGLTTEQARAYGTAIAGQEGYKGLEPILKMTDKELWKLAESMYGAEGAAQAMADVKMDSLFGDMLTLRSAIEGVQLAIGERLQPALRSFVQWATTKMPDVTKVFNSAFDWAEAKHTEISFKVNAMVETEEWQNGDLFQKVTMTFDTLVGDPFKEWWEGSGRALALEYGGKIGQTMGSVLSGGLMMLFGIGLSETASEGAKVGAAFVEGFKEGFDFDGVAQGLLNAFKAVSKEAGKILPGGEEATTASWLSAGLLGIGAAKVGGAVSSIGKGASTLYQGGRAIVGGAGRMADAVFPRTSDFISGLKYTVQANNSAASSAVRSAAGFAQSGAFGRAGQLGASTGNLVNKGAAFLGSPFGRTATKVGGKALGVLGLGLEAASGVGQAENWTGGTSTGDKVASGVGAVLGGTGDGIMGEKSFLGKALDIGGGALKGATAGAMVGGVPGAIVGGVAGAAGAAIGGENIAGFLSSDEFQDGVYNYFDNLHKAWTTFWEETGKFFFTTIPTALGKVGKGITSFFTETIPEKFGELMDGARTFFGETVPFAIGYIGGKVYGFFTETVPRKFEELVEGATAFFTETIPTALETVGSGIVVFFTETAPEFFMELWEGATTFFTETVPAGVEMVGEGVIGFFTVTVPEFFIGLWDGAVVFFTETIPTGLETIGLGVVTFFTETVPDFFIGLWEDAKEAFVDPIKEAREAIDEGIQGFFTTAKEKVSGFFSNAWQGVQDFGSTAWNFVSSGFSSGSTAAHAEGGILSTPHIGLVAEDGPEAIIPLSGKRRSRGIELWERAGELLGVKPYAEGGIVGLLEGDEAEPVFDVSTKTKGGNKGAPVVSVPVTIQNVTFAVNVNGNGEGMTTEKLVEIIKENVANLTDEIARNLANTLAEVFANMPRAVEA